MYKNLTICELTDISRLSPPNGSRLFIIGIINLFLCPIAVALNSLTVMAILMTKKLRTKINVLICNVCISDLFVGLVVHMTLGIHFTDRSKDLCDVARPIGMFLLLTSFFSLLAASTERYLAVLHPFLYQRVFSDSVFLCTMASLWITPGIVVSVTELFSSDGLVLSVFQIVMLVIGFAWMTFVNLKSFLVVRKIQMSDRSIERRLQAPEEHRRKKGDYKITLFTIASQLVMAVSYFPFTVVSIQLATSIRLSISVPFFASLTVLCSNSSLNAVLLLSIRQEIRRAIRHVLRFPSNRVTAFREYESSTFQGRQRTVKSEDS